MSIYNYFLIGFIFTFIMDAFGDLSNSPIKFDWAQRILCIIIWPITAVMFIIALVKQWIK